VLRRDPHGDPNRLFAQCPGHDVDRLDWHDGQILDEEWGIIIELNHSLAKVV